VISLQGEAKAYQTFFAFIGVSLIPLNGMGLQYCQEPG
jgi:hypothetical protein